MIEKVDFLIIGAGISGLSTAIELQKFGKVLLLLKNGYEEKINEFIKDKEKSLITTANPADKDYIEFLIKQDIEISKKIAF